MLVKQENTPDMYLNIIIALRRTFFFKRKEFKVENENKDLIFIKEKKRFQECERQEQKP